jgi:hypothetical protein
MAVPILPAARRHVPVSLSDTQLLGRSGWLGVTVSSQKAAGENFVF